MDLEKVKDNTNTQQQQSQEAKKQVVRRRVHSSKPYQERLLNMAEARREIATALKFHRASMKQQQASAVSNHQFQSPQIHPNFSDSYYKWPTSAIVPPPPSDHENLNLVLPNRTIGLNLNYQDFNNLNTRIYRTPMPVRSSSSASSSSAAAAANSCGGVRWCKSLEAIGIAPAEDRNEDDDPFEQIMEFPPWLMNTITNESTCLHELYDPHFSDEYYSPDPALPCMDIGEIEGFDGEWLA